MTILYPAPAPVKAARRFGIGILPTPRPFQPSPEESAWWAAESARLERERLENERLELMAGESAAVDRHERGIILY